jgi:hypothetical protein
VQEEILERNPDADLRVYVVWLPVLATDERFEVADLLVDPRATHFWDGGRLVSDALAGVAGVPADGLLWDAFLVFAPDAAWESAPPEPVARGAPVVSEVQRLERALEPYLG